MTSPRLKDLRILNDYTTTEFTKNPTRPATPADLLAVLTSMGAETETRCVDHTRDDACITTEFVTIRKDALEGRK